MWTITCQNDKVGVNVSLYDAVIQSKEPLVILTDQKTKIQLVNQLSNQKVFKSMQFLSQKDLYKKVFFSYNDETLFTIGEMLNVQPKIAKTLINHLYVIDLKKTYHSDWLERLKDIKNQLIKKEIIEQYRYLKQLLKNKRVLSTLDNSDLNEEALRVLKTYTKVDKIPVTLKNAVIYEGSFNRFEDEVIHLAMRLRQSSSLKGQTIVVTHDDYQPIIERIFKQFEIPFEWMKGSPILSYPQVQKFMTKLSDDSKDIQKSIEEALIDFKEHDLPIMRRLYVKIVQIINQLAPYYTQPDKFLRYLKYRLEETRFKLGSFDGAISIGMLGDLIVSDFATLHVLGCSEGLFPSLIKPYDTLSNAEREELGLSTIETVNQFEKTRLKNHLMSIDKVYLSYSEKGNSEVFYRSHFLDEINIERASKGFPNIVFEEQPFSKRYDLMYAKELYDLQDQSNHEIPLLRQFYHWFKDDLRPHNPQFKKLSQATINQIHGRNLSMSYSKLNTFYKCQFRYLMDYILKIDEPMETLAIDIGQLFHEVLEKYYHEETLSDSLLETTLQGIIQREKRDYSDREWFFLRHSYPSLKTVFNVIKEQERVSDYQVLEREIAIEKNYQIKDKVIRFSGVIDKLLVRYDKDITHVIMFDYKTGKPTLKINHSYYGFDSQLVFYTVLLKQYFNQKPYALNGFYEQLVYPKPPKYQQGKTKEEQIKDALKWVGYTVSDQNEVRKIDPNVDEDSMIFGMRLKNDGDFYSTVKTYPRSLLDPLSTHVEKKIVQAVEKILEGDFKINPKRNQVSKDLSCAYCQYNDICYKRYEDYETIHVPNDLQELIEFLDGGESNEH